MSEQASDEQAALLLAYTAMRTIGHPIPPPSATNAECARWWDEEEKWMAAMDAIEVVCPAARELAEREPSRGN